MVSVRIVLALVVLGAVSAHDASLASFGNGIYDKVMHLWQLGQSYRHEDAGKTGLDEHRVWHPEMRIAVEKAHACHEKCGGNVDCHSKCPKPWAAFTKACEALPTIKPCRAKCKDADCDKCPKFDVEWMKTKFLKRPEDVITMVEAKCPMVAKAHACHQACITLDQECHHKCHSTFNGQVGHWHHHEDKDGHPHRQHGDHHGHHDDHRGHHDNHDDRHGHHENQRGHHNDRSAKDGHFASQHGERKQWHEMTEKVHACHEKCGSDASCHSRCPKPWKPFVQACRDFPAIKACLAKCKDADCDKCPKFELEWMNQKFAKRPEQAIKMAEEKCPMMEKVHTCHQACKPGDHECHHKCPSMFDGHHESGHHHSQHGEQKHWQKMHQMMEKTSACHKKCGDDAVCHAKCPKPWTPFVEACQDLPAIKACRATCKDAACDKCPKFAMDWMNKKLAKHPEYVTKKAEAKCQLIEKAHACHQACSAGDFECHCKCPSMFHGQHGHRRGEKAPHGNNKHHRGQEQREENEHHHGEEQRQENDHHRGEEEQQGHHEQHHGEEEQHGHHEHRGEEEQQEPLEAFEQDEPIFV